MANGTFGGGDGTPANPYLVEDALDLLALREGPVPIPVFYKQVKDISLAAYNPWVPVNYFYANYNGGGYSIRDLSSTSTGVFGVICLRLFGKIENVRVESGVVNDCSSGGFICGVLSAGGVISNCHVSGNITSSTTTGGITGTISAGDVYNSSFSGGVFSKTHASISRAGGIAGFCSGGLIEDCSSSGSVESASTAAYTAEAGTGGLVGHAKGGLINRSFSTSVVRGIHLCGGFIGSVSVGLDGSRHQFLSAQDCYSTGDVIATGGDIGAFIGPVRSGSATNCYATGSVKGASNVAGFYARSIAGAVFSTISCYSLSQSLHITGGSTIYRFSPTTDGVATNCYALVDVESVGGQPIIASTTMTISDISLPDAKKQATYEHHGWKFVQVWAIKEDISYPVLLKRGDPHAIAGGPGESIKTNVFVDKHPDGTMFYKGEIYRSMRIGQLLSKFVGAPGEQVTQVWEGKRQTATDGNTYVFLASGVQDPDFPGGYGGYTADTSRTVTLRSDRSINVNFYYTASEFPPYNYLMRVSVPEGAVHIAVLKEDVSSIKVKMHDGSICTVDIVLPDDEQASPIRVMLPTGIYALKKIEVSD